MKIDNLIDELIAVRRAVGNLELSTWDGCIENIKFSPALNGEVCIPLQANEISMEIICKDNK